MRRARRSEKPDSRVPASLLVRRPETISFLTYNDRTVTHLHIKWGVALGPTVIGAGTRHLPFPHTCPRNQPALAQTYATAVFREGQVSGVQMLTVGRGLRTTATAAVGPG